MGAALAQPPQAGRVHAADDDPAFRHEHALHLAQGGMRVGVELQRVGQYDQVQAVGRKRQGGKVAVQVDAGVFTEPALTMLRGCATVACVSTGMGRVHTVANGIGRLPAVRHAVGLQRVELGATQLQCMETEDVGHHTVKLRLLPVQQVPSLRGLEEVMQTYNLSAHEAESCS